MFGHWEIFAIVLIALLLFGNRLPSVMRSVGRGFVEFKKGIQGVEDDVKTAANPKIEKEEEPQKETTA